MLSSQRAALVLGHPGHELRVLGWLRACRPRVAVLTDGSGHANGSRLEQTTEILAATGCEPGEIYGRFTDRDIYAAILRGDAGFFRDIGEQLASWLVTHRIELVASDGIEGYNPTHDLCAAVVGCAVRLASALGVTPIRHYTFPLVGPALPESELPGALLIELDEPALVAKLTLSRQYASRAGGALVEEVEEMITRLGRAAFAQEMLAPAVLARDFAPFAAAPPFYETHGERQVVAGHYRDVIRYRQHMAPLFQALEE